MEMKLYQHQNHKPKMLEKYTLRVLNKFIKKLKHYQNIKYKKKDGKSINWKWFHAHAFELKRLKNPVRWEVIPLIEENL